MESKEIGKRIAEIASSTTLDPQTLFNTTQLPEFQQLSQIKSPEAINSFIDGMFSQMLTQAKEVGKKEEDLEQVKGLLNQYGSFIQSMANKDVEGAGVQLKELFVAYEKLRTEPKEIKE